jgi:signal recognition particle subunit SRP54
VEVGAVKSLVERFFEARKMMSRLMQGGGMPGVPGVPGMGGGAGARKKKQVKQAKGKQRSGNPMKRKAVEQAAAARREQQADAPFGLPAAQDPADFELPEEFKKFMR